METKVPNIVKNEKDHRERTSQQKEEFQPSHDKEHLLVTNAACQGISGPPVPPRATLTVCDMFLVRTSGPPVPPRATVTICDMIPGAVTAAEELTRCHWIQAPVSPRLQAPLTLTVSLPGPEKSCPRAGTGAPTRSGVWISPWNLLGVGVRAGRAERVWPRGEGWGVSPAATPHLVTTCRPLRSPATAANVSTRDSLHPGRLQTSYKATCGSRPPRC